MMRVWSMGMNKKLIEWFAVKRTKDSKSFQLFEPNIRNKEIIDAIAPEKGNYLVFSSVRSTENLYHLLSKIMDFLGRCKIVFY